MKSWNLVTPQSRACTTRSIIGPLGRPDVIFRRSARAKHLLSNCILFVSKYLIWHQTRKHTPRNANHTKTTAHNSFKVTNSTKRQNHQDEVLCTSTPCSCCCCSVHHGTQGRSTWRGKCPSPSQRNGRRRLHVFFWKSKKMLLYVINEWVSFLNVSFMMEDRSLNYASLIAWFDIWCHE
jgi:hypothetical protein